MGITASIAAPSVIAGSTITGEQPKVTRMEVPGIKGADGDITWQGEWSSATTYTQNEAVQYNGSAYVALQGNSNLIPSSNASSWSVMTSKGDTGPAGASGSAGTVTIGSTTTGSTGGSASVTNSGTSSEAVLNFTIPKGNTGQQGGTGNTGPTGSTGAAGDNATIQIGTITTLVEDSNATVANVGTDTAAVLNFGLPMGQTGAQGTFRWKGAYNNSYTYGVNDVAYYNGSSYVAIQGTVGNVPTITSKWEKMAAAGAEGGSIGSMSDTNIAISPSDASIIMYNTSNSKWEDNNVFGTNRAALQLDGGTF
jgi:hypothetical protein